MIEPEDIVKLVDKVVKLIRKAMKNINDQFSGGLAQNWQQKSIPTEPITLVSMLIEGNNVNNYTSQNILTCTQILVYNFILKTKPQASISENIKKLS